MNSVEAATFTEQIARLDAGPFAATAKYAAEQLALSAGGRGIATVRFAPGDSTCYEIRIVAPLQSAVEWPTTMLYSDSDKTELRTTYDRGRQWTRRSYMVELTNSFGKMDTWNGKPIAPSDARRKFVVGNGRSSQYTGAVVARWLNELVAQIAAVPAVTA